MADTFIIKHAVGGRVFLDSSKQEIRYSLDYASGGGHWRLEAETPLTESIKELLRWSSELNVFLFPETAEGAPVRKLWFYVKEQGAAYNEAEGKLTLHGDSMIEYVPSAFGYV
ncbi:hypothetical protein [Paenibacillus protaetiae]|uniref:Uncharacterized protein n=1 Tax=Paenibacillus protaetiae TaxID=2509456 RepID=A0A4P6FAV7_9BACL|nr:hypothetical protein [Paenibacillus protaetiae]QAY67648.1 hypothetical protein ET464_15915 [Paenibacillus protaetiae]